MDILKNLCVLFLLFICVCNAINTKKHNQTIHTEMAKNNSERIHFIEDEIEDRTGFDKINKKLNEPDIKIKLTQKENTTNEGLRKDLVRPKITTPKIISENKVVKAIPIPIDLLLKHPKIINFSKDKHNTTEILTKNKESIKCFNSEPKIAFCEDTIKVVDDEVSDFYKKVIFTNEKPNKTLENKLENTEDLEEIKMHNDDSDKEPIRDGDNSSAKPFKDSNKINHSTNKNETLKEQTGTPTIIEIIINNDLGNSNAASLSGPNSTIVIHNRKYQEIIQPMKLYNYIPRSYYYPYYYPSQNNYWSHKPYLCRRYTDPYQFYNIGPYCKPTLYSNEMKSNIVWKAWNNMDICMHNPPDVNLNYDGISDALDSDKNKPTHEYIEDENNVYDVFQDTNVNYN